MMQCSGVWRCLGGLLLCGAALTHAQPGEVVITYATNPNYPPYDWSVANRAYDGASIELLEQVKPPGVTFRPVVYPWKRAQLLAAKGEIDLLVSLRMTPERMREYEFTTHRAFPNPIALFVRKDRQFAFSDWSILHGRRGGYSAGDSFGGGFDEYWRQHLSMEEAPSLENNFNKLLLGRIDYFVSGYYLGLSYIACHPDLREIVALKPFISEQDIYFAFSKKSPRLSYLDAISQKLQELDRRGVPEAILKKHLARFSSPSPPILP